MHFSQVLAGGVLALASSALAVEIPQDHYLWGPGGALANAKMEKRQSATATTTKVADSACTNGPLTRSCWSNGYSVATDFDAKWPNTGVTRSVSLTTRSRL